MTKNRNRILTTAAISTAIVAVTGCTPQPQPAPPPFPALTQNCTATNRPDIVVSPGKGVRISVGRLGYEPSVVSIGVLVDDQVKEDGRIYPPGPDASLHAYRVNNPLYFAPSSAADRPRHLNASMVWSSNGAVYDKPPIYTTVCLLVDGATISFYTAHRPEPNTIVNFDFYPERRVKARKPRRKVPEEAVPKVPDETLPKE